MAASAFHYSVHGISLISKRAFQLAALLLIFLVFLIVEQVISRYLFNINSVALQELQWHLFGAIISLSMAYAFYENAHVRVDVLSNRCTQGYRRFINAIGCLVLIPLALTLAYFGWMDVLTARSFQNTFIPDYYTTQLITEHSVAYPLVSNIEEFLRNTIFMGEGSPDPGGLGARWIIRSMFPIGMLLLALQSFAILLFCLIPSLRDDEGPRWV